MIAINQKTSCTRRFPIFLCLFAILLSAGSPAYAFPPEPTEITQVLPISLRFEHIKTATASLKISGTTATVGGTSSGYAGATKVAIKVQLQRKSGSGWVTVKTWSTSTSGSTAIIDETYTVSSGRTYRVVNTATVHVGRSSESSKATSGESTVK